MGETVTDPRCGKSWVQRGNKTGHCARCHETFEGVTAFDAHLRIGKDGHADHLDPATVKVSGHLLRLVDGTWRGPAMPAELVEVRRKATESKHQERGSDVQSSGALAGAPGVPTRDTPTIGAVA